MSVSLPEAGDVPEMRCGEFRTSVFLSVWRRT